ncbi:MAG: tetratricopeptide repeat protein [Leptolyngbya sp. SIOISBB]|nr:tetratricopeptide repeat protein [Leptolyngbya sp. SIOISBB]
MSSTQNLLGGRYQFIEALSVHPLGRTLLVADAHYPGHPKCIVRERRLTTRNSTKRQAMLRRLQQKVAILETMGQHPQVPNTFVAFDEAQSFYVVEEFIPGQSLLNLLADRKRWTVAEAIAGLRDVLPILHFAQTHQIIHGHLKPSKLVHHQLENRWNLLDFGSIKNIGQPPADSYKTENHNGNSTAPIIYLAPEQLQHQTQFCSDYYALGMIVIQGLTGVPLEKLPTAQTLARHERLTALLYDVPDLPPQLGALLLRMVDSQPQRRYQKAVDILHDLDRLPAVSALTNTKVAADLKPLEAQSVEIVPRSHPVSRSSRSWLWLMLSVVGLLALVGTTAMVVFQLPQRWAAQEQIATAEAIAADDPEAAIAAYTQALESLPNQPEALAARSRLSFEQGDAQAALADISAAIAQAPDNSAYAYDRANYRFAVGDIQGAIADYTQAIDLDPTFTKAYVNRGSARADWGDDRGAIDDYTQAIELATTIETEAAAHLNRCLSYSNLGEQELALSDCSAAINQRPSHALAYQNRGLVRRRLEDFQGSLQDYNIAIQIDPNSPDPFYNRGLTRQALNDLPGALADLSQAIAIDPNYVFALYDRGLLHAEMNNHQAALQDLQTASQVCLDLGRTGCYDDAQFQIDQLQKLVDAEPEPALPESLPEE